MPPLVGNPGYGPDRCMYVCVCVRVCVCVCVYARETSVSDDMIYSGQLHRASCKKVYIA